ncbi:MAG: hypothetical protein RI897_586 [Verrucomicrobiota bacterium]
MVCQVKGTSIQPAGLSMAMTDRSSKRIGIRLSSRPSPSSMTEGRGTHLVLGWLVGNQAEPVIQIELVVCIANDAAAKEPARPVIGVGLDTQRDGFFAQRKRGGDGREDIEKLARIVALEGLRAENLPVDDQVEGAVSAIAAPVGADECVRLIRVDIESEGEPTAIGGVSPFAAIELAGGGVFPGKIVVAFGLHLSDPEDVDGAGFQGA